ncbi:hypothetical protein ES703_58436 [subsurface metagenome]
MTGSSSRMALFNNPLKSAGSEGNTTFKPGTCMNHDSNDWECCAAPIIPTPNGTLIVTGTEICAPYIYLAFAA